MFTQRKFPKLAELDLTGNQFSSVKMLGNLPTLKILILQANKVETLHYNSDMSVSKGLNGCQVTLNLFRTCKFWTFLTTFSRIFTDLTFASSLNSKS
jgi:hypothetical protein